jgi:hypoxanthine phosphoribosyltransferase
LEVNVVDNIYPSYNEIHHEVIEYANIVKENGVQFDAIIALARGGSLIGTILSHALEIPLTNISYSSQHGNGETKSWDLLHVFQSSRILIVDDICDSGHTLNELMNYYEKDRHQNIVTTYAVYFRNTADSVHLPNYSIQLNGDEWIVFPWENTNSIPFNSEVI